MIKKKKTDDQKIKVYSAEGFFTKLIKFIGFKFIDLWDVIKNGRKFNLYGMTLMVGDQGSGKSMALVEELERIRKDFPKALIITNFGYINQHQEFNDWNDFFEIRNGADGVVFALDEIQNEFNSNAWKNFPEELLSEITQQRKQKVKIFATAQVYQDVAVQLRRQTLYVAECSTLAERWTVVRCFRRKDYERAQNFAEGTQKVQKVYKRSFVQNAELRELYDTEKKIERLARTRFLSKKDRGVAQ